MQGGLVNRAKAVGEVAQRQDKTYSQGLRPSSNAVQHLVIRCLVNAGLSMWVGMPDPRICHGYTKLACHSRAGYRRSYRNLNGWTVFAGDPLLPLT
ncbi:hypothetical protein AVO44_16010 [Ruegeria profundi]|uniref:Uncharacterized protein n=1 Tax=Ruegeria profundi TaxID=1685378 RepID=A0A0X3TQ32_9RHOB|nr:hypothetical protein AVO44_16010 [Ruegeria profundi]